MVFKPLGVVAVVYRIAATGNDRYSSGEEGWIQGRIQGGCSPLYTLAGIFAAHMGADEGVAFRHLAQRADKHQGVAFHDIATCA
jgi:hypothetical protein